MIRAGGEHGFLREYRGQARGVLDQVEAPVAEPAHVLERRGVAAAPERDHAGGDAARSGRAHQRESAMALLGVGAVGEQKKMLQVDGFADERGVSGIQREIDVDATAARTDGADLRAR